MMADMAKRKPYNLLRYDPYILPSNENKAIPSMTSERFNQLQEDLEIERQEYELELIQKLLERKEQDE